jgi:hypothetical protein
MNGLIILLGIAVGFTGHSAIAKHRLTDPVRIARDCKSDLERLCVGLRPGGQRIKNCLIEKVAELSPSCLGALRATE